MRLYQLFFAFIAVSSLVGCRTAARSSRRPEKSVQIARIDTDRIDAQTDAKSKLSNATPVTLVSTSSSTYAVEREFHDSDSDGPIARPIQASELDVESLVNEVKARNPSLQSAMAAYREALQKHPQAIAIEDPLLQSMMAPQSFSSSSPVQSSFYIGVAQKVPWAGKRELRGQRALWEAESMRSDTTDVMLKLELAARIEFLNYYLVYRELDLNQQNFELVRELRSTAKSKYEAGQVSQQDVSIADLELAKLGQIQIELKRPKPSCTRIGRLGEISIRSAS